jgi:hypothetical protein
MPRPKRNTASPRFTAHPHVLSTSARTTLLEALGIDTGVEAEDDHVCPALPLVQDALGAFPAFVKNVDGAPRPADYRAALTPICKTAERLANEIGSLNGYIFDALNIALNVTQVEIYATELSLLKLRAAAIHVLDLYGNSESRGRPRAEALQRLVRTLIAVYEQHSRVERDERATFGNQSNLSEWEASRLEFVGAALTDARIPFPDDLPAVIRAALLIDGR